MIYGNNARRRSIRVGFAVIAVFLAGNTAAALWSARLLHQSGQEIDQVYELLGTISSVFSALQDAETGQRGYIITGDVDYLAPLNAAVVTVDPLLDDLDRQTRDFPLMAELAVELRRLSTAKLSAIGVALVARKIGFADAEQLIATHEGKNLMDRIREVHRRMNEAGREMLDYRSQASLQSLRRLRVNIAAGMVVSILLVAGIGGTLHNANQITIKAHKESLFNEKRYRTLVEATSAIVWRTPASGQVVGDLPGWSAFTGQTTAEVAGGGWVQALHPDDRERTRRIWSTAVAERGIYEVEHRLRRRDGVYRIMLARGVPVLGDDGTILEWIGRHTDVTDQKLAEVALAESERFTRSTLDSLSTHIAILDEHGTILATNRAWREFAAGNSAQGEVGVGANYLNVCDNATGRCGEEAAVVATGIRAMLRGEPNVFPIEYPCHSPTEKRWFTVRAALFEGDGPVRVVIAHENITAAKLADEEREKFVALVENSIDFIGMATMSGEVIYTNPAARELVEFDPAEHSGVTHIRQFHSDEGNRLLEEDVLPSLKATGRWEGELPLRNFRTGRTIEAQSSIFVVRHPKSGEPLCMAAISRDISQRKSAEEALRQAKTDAETANRAKSEFLANMSHEIRTPMNGVIGMTDLLLDGDLSADQRESLDMVRSSAESLMTVINDILDFSKIEAGKLDLEATEFSLHTLLVDTLKPLALRAHRKGLELNYDVPADVPAFVVGDPGRLRQVIVNLVGNAIKFTECGEVVLQTKLRECSADEYVIEIAVIDTGIGIPRARQAAIFAPFAQADGSTTRKFGGTGLGLTISSQLVSLMGGTIEVESRAGLGSTFRFCVRFARPRDAQSSATVDTAADLRGVAVLVVDDNATNRRILEEMLKHWDARPMSVESGSAALEEMARAAAAGEPYPLVLVDAVMPEMDGFALVELIQRQSDYAPPTIMMLTSLDRQGDAERCRQLGLAAYLIKPIRAADLRRAVDGCLGRGHLVEDIAQPAGRERGLSKPRADGTSLRILLAEDNPVNQRVALHHLQKQGHRTTVVGDGSEALAALEREPFDVVLMDVQMPEMDGFETARAIRAAEAGTGRRLPIIAMTAHAMKGDRERCFEAGMNEYVAKPIRASDLFRALQAVSGVAAPPLVPEEPEALGETAEPEGRRQTALDRKSALDRLGGDENFFREVVDIFLAQAPHRREEIRSAVVDGDVDRLRKATHSLQGAIGYLGADPAALSTVHLEAMIGGDDRAASAEALAAFERLFDAVTLAITKLVSVDNNERTLDGAPVNS